MPALDTSIVPSMESASQENLTRRKTKTAATDSALATTGVRGVGTKTRTKAYMRKAVFVSSAEASDALGISVVYLVTGPYAFTLAFQGIAGKISEDDERIATSRKRIHRIEDRLCDFD
jgi:hypothetical protein